MSERPCIFGEVLFDHFPDGRRVLGGAPFNVAWHLRAFGEVPLLVSRIGHDPDGAAVVFDSRLELSAAGREVVVLDLGRAEGVMPSRERVPTEEYQVGDRIRAYLLSVEYRLPITMMRRSSPLTYFSRITISQSLRASSIAARSASASRTSTPGFPSTSTCVRATRAARPSCCAVSSSRRTRSASPTADRDWCPPACRRAARSRPATWPS